MNCTSIQQAPHLSVTQTVVLLTQQKLVRLTDISGVNSTWENYLVHTIIHKGRSILVCINTPKGNKCRQVNSVAQVRLFNNANDKKMKNNNRTLLLINNFIFQNETILSIENSPDATRIEQQTMFFLSTAVFKEKNQTEHESLKKANCSTSQLSGSDKEHSKINLSNMLYIIYHQMLRSNLFSLSKINFIKHTIKINRKCLT